MRTHNYFSFHVQMLTFNSERFQSSENFDIEVVSDFGRRNTQTFRTKSEYNEQFIIECVLIDGYIVTWISACSTNFFYGNFVLWSVISVETPAESPFLN